MRKAQGVTLLELLMTLTVAGVLTALAIPNFNNALRNSQRSAAVTSLFHTLFYARNAAIRRGKPVTVCASFDGATCRRSGDWASGWITFVNLDRDEPPQRDANEPLLNVASGWPQGSISSNRAAFSFRSYVHGVVNGTVLFCDERGGQHARVIIVSHTGRPRVSQRDGSNRPLRCPGD
jgi:type IV fimbrial biogenesis protein FimT